MSSFFSKETTDQAGQTIDHGRLTEIESHQLLQVDDQSDQIASFDQIEALAGVYLRHKFEHKLSSSERIRPGLLRKLNEGRIFLGKIVFNSDLSNEFPVTVEVVDTNQGQNLRIHIVPIHTDALEEARSKNRDSYLALAAAAAAAPQFLLALEGGIETTQCSTKKELVTSITPDHGTPLAVTFDAFDFQTNTLDTASGVTGNPGLNIKQAAHLHGQSTPNTQRLSTAVSGSGIAAGIPITTILRDSLPKHDLFLSVKVDEDTGNPHLLSFEDMLMHEGIQLSQLPFIAAALGFTAKVVGNSEREKMVEKIFRPDQADTPLRVLFRQ